MWGYPEYVTVAEKKAKAQKKLAQLKKNKKYQNIEPIVIEGRTISKSWWGKAWCKNLESYSDYENRIGRGRSYVKNGFVIDLKMSRGKIESLVQGSGSNPYKCTIQISQLDSKKWDNIKSLTESKFASLQILIDGKFPKELQEVFSMKGKGIFPSPKEIKFDCSCPDWAEMCKHISATLYAVGAKLDSNPELLFLLRGVNMEELISSTISAHKSSILDKATNVKSTRIIDLGNAPLSKLFDIDFKA